MTDHEIREEHLQDRKPNPLSVKQLFDSIRSLEQLKQRFVFYTPITYYLIADQRRTEFSTDLISNLLGSALQEHPLVITELSQPIFRPAETLLLNENHRSFLRTLYAVPREAWLSMESALNTLNIVDRLTQRFCVFRPHIEQIPCPFGKFEAQALDVYYFNCYGNQETYFFHPPESISPHRTDSAPDLEYTPKLAPPQLYYTAPIREIVDFGKRLFTAMETSPSIEAFRSSYKESNTLETYAKAPQQIYEEQAAAIQAKNKVHDTSASKPLNESQLSAKEREECYALIRRYREVYGTAYE
jgi:hypothetical protein